MGHSLDQVISHYSLIHVSFRLPGGLDQALVVLIRLGGYAEVFPQLSVRAEFHFAFSCPGTREDLWIGNCQLGFERAIAGAPVPLDSPHLIGMRKAADAISSVFGDPRPVVVARSFHD